MRTYNALQLYLNQLIEYAEIEFNFTVNVNSNATYYYPDEQLITIHHAQLLPRKCCSVLHELGHCKQAAHEFEKINTSIGRKALIIQQEISAWDEGWNIHNTFKRFHNASTMKFIDDMYWKEAASCINTYIDAVTKYTPEELQCISTSYMRD
jgi:hypothetical protein